MMNIKFRTYFTIIIANFIAYTQAFADIASPDSDFGLPFTKTSVKPHTFLSKWIAETIKYVGLLAVFSLTIWWIMYIVSFWEDAKIKKARNLIVYSIVWVVVAWMAYALVWIVNSIGI